MRRLCLPRGRARPVLLSAERAFVVFIEPSDERICDVVLRDGSTLAVRPVREDDINALVRFFTELSPESRHYLA